MSIDMLHEGSLIQDSKSSCMQHPRTIGQTIREKDIEHRIKWNIHALPLGVTGPVFVAASAASNSLLAVERPKEVEFECGREHWLRDRYIGRIVL